MPDLFWPTAFHLSKAPDMPSELRTERRGAALVLTISGPGSRNSLSAQVFAAGVEALSVAESDKEVRCIVLQGEGQHFCAGGNLQRLGHSREAGPEVQGQMLDHFHGFVEALRACPKPVIAAVEGAAAGGGFSLALACDLIVAASNAKFVLSYGRIGLSPDGGATWHLLQALPRQRVLQLLWLGEPISVDELHRAGLVAEVADSGDALNQALRLADRLAQAAPNAIASVKELLQQVPGHSLQQQLAAEREQFLENLFHPNCGEGFQAFFDKRTPQFQ
jgi:enoyl-CoA hydratase/carnithine racemase